MRFRWFVAAIAIVAIISDRSFGYDLFLVPAEGGESQLLLSDENRAYGSPQWSPDGKVIAMDTWPLDRPNASFTDAHIGLYTIETKEFKTIGPGAMPSWSPDATQLVCHTYNPSQIVVLNADGSGREVILDQWGSPRWSPDGQIIYTAHQGGGVGAFNLRTGKQTIAAAKHSRLWQGLSVSADGKWLCFSASEGGLGVANRGEGEYFQTEWKWPRFDARHSSWSPDSKQIVARVDSTGEVETRKGLFYLDPTGEQPPKLVPGSGKKWWGIDPDWSPDGKRIVCTGSATLEKSSLDDSAADDATSDSASVDKE